MNKLTTHMNRGADGQVKPNASFRSIVRSWCAVLLVLTVISAAQAQNQDYTEMLGKARLFDGHLVWLGANPPGQAESQELWDAFGVGQNTNTDQCLEKVESFLQGNPNSAWTPSLHAQLAKYYFDTVRFTLALSHFEAAWQATKSSTDQNGRQVADFALVNWLRLLASLGRTDTLKFLVEETQHREVLRPFQEDYRTMLEAYAKMVKHPEFAYKCGTFAMNSVATVLCGSNIYVGILDQPSPSTGFSVATLAKLAKAAQLDLVAVQRDSGDELVVPSVVHWRQNHYAAIISKQGNHYRVVDPTFRMARWETAEAINGEASGYFMISAKGIPSGWHEISASDAAGIFGKGYPSAWVDQPGPPCTTCPCPPGSSGSGDSGNGGRGGRGGGSKSEENGSDAGKSYGLCPTCGNSFPSSPGGMPTWIVSEPNIDLWVQDEPLAYQPATGPRVSAAINYNEHSTMSVDSSVFGMGPSWGFSWLSYVDLGSGKLFNQGGGSITYTDTTGTSPNYFDNSLLLYINDGSGNPISCRITNSSGGMRIFGFRRTTALNAVGYAFLTQSIDPAGRTTTFVYQPWDPLTNDVVRLLYVVDADGLTNTISYTNAANFGSCLIGKIIDPYNRTANFIYDQNGNLTNVVDVIGLSSSFKYGVPPAYPFNTWLTNMHTPYGTTTFAYTIPYTNSNNRGVVITDSDGGQEMVTYEGEPDEDSYPTGTPKTFTDTSNVPTSRPTGSLLNNPDWNNPSVDDAMNWANSHYWNRQQFAALSASFLATGPSWDYRALSTNDYFNCRLRKWNETPSAGQINNLGMERLPSPDHVTVGKMTWYDYPGKVNGSPYIVCGSSAFPSLTLRVLPDGSNWYEQRVYDQWGNLTNFITTYSSAGSVLLRTNRYIFAANGVDLLYSIGPDGITNASYVYNANHRVLSATNAVGDVTINTYNGNQQLTSIKYPTQLISTNIYYANSFLATNYEYSTVGGTSYFRSNYFTYASGLIATKTDERGLTVAYNWDNLQRLTSEVYPNGTNIYVYTNLDLIRMVDRLSFTNSFGYDSIHRKVAETNAMGNVTTYGYCPCGGLAYTTNALGQVTQFVYDYQGNLVTTLYADGYNVTNQFDTVRRVVQTTETGGRSTTNAYDNQGLLLTVSNALGQVQATVYDIDDRPTSQTDANGVTVSTSYDNLGRAISRTYPDSGVEKLGYSAFGLMVYTNQLGFTNTYAYDAARRKSSELNANGEFTQFQYDSSGNLTNLLDGKTNSTKWNYDQYGRVTNKVDAASNVLFTYGYDADDRLTGRTNATSIWTLYSYDKNGNLTNVAYRNNATITNSYDVLNRMTKMVDGLGATVYAYDAASQVLSEGGLWAEDTVNYTYQNRLRTGLSLLAPNASPWVEGYGYDSARRLTNVTSSAGAFGYGYDSTRHTQVGKLTLPNGAYITNVYDNVAHLLSTALKNSGNTALNSHNYGYNSGNQRTALTNFAGDYRQYTYDKVGQLKTALGKESGGVANRWQEQLGYAYDAGGNLSWRTNYALAQAFNVNNLNELTTGTNAGTLTVAGTTTSLATNVSVWGTSLSSGSAVLYADATWVRTNVTRPGGNATYNAAGYDSLGRNDTNTINAFLPNSVTYTYDLNGNLLNDGTRYFTYDDESQLTVAVVSNAWLSKFTYDGKLRRRIRREFTWSAGAWLQTNEVRYVYDGNLPVQERDINNLPAVTYTRGRDLSGSLQGAGGIRGLLARTDSQLLTTGSPTANAFYHGDGNGNVTALVSTNQVLVAKYLYDPYGNVMSQSGPLAAANTYQFSSKEFHVNSGLVYYLYRCYDPNMQRWANRDPLGEPGFELLRGLTIGIPQGLRLQRWRNRDLLGKLGFDFQRTVRPALLGEGPNYYQFVMNAPTGFVDPDGRSKAGCASALAWCIGGIMAAIPACNPFTGWLTCGGALLAGPVAGCLSAYDSCNKSDFPCGPDPTIPPVRPPPWGLH